jgi:CRISPR-associated protein Csx10
MIELRARALEPLHLTASPEAANATSTLPYVPGSALRGALASHWIVEHGLPTQSEANLSTFTDLFEGRIRYRPLTVEGATTEPLSLWRCKYRMEPGCRSHEIDRATDPDPAGPPQRCPACDSPMVAAKGRTDVATVSRTRTQLSSNETAEDGNLFTREALPAGTELRGWLHTDHPWFGELAGRSPITVWIGGRRSIGGRTELEVSTGHRPVPPARDDGYVVVRLVSPGVFVDRFARPSLRFPLGEICRHLGCAQPADGDVASWTRPTRVGGWHLASGLPKPVDLALAPGSTLRFRPPSPVDPAALAELERHGIGLRRAEGLGAVEVNPSPARPVPAEAIPADRGDRTAPGATLFRQVRHELLPTGDEPHRLWVVDQLKEHALAVEHGDPERSRRRILALTTTQDLPYGTRRALDDVLSEPALSTLNQVIVLADTNPGFLDTVPAGTPETER